MPERSAESTSVRGTKPPGAHDTAVRPAITDRLQEKFAAAQERRGKGGALEANGTKRPRQARLRLTRVDPWSVMRTAFLLSIAFGIVTIVSVLMIWSVLGAAGVWDSINSSVRDILGGDDGANFNVESYVGTSRVVGFTMLVAVVDVVLLTAIATLGAFLYNMAAALLGGVEVTLSEDR